MSTQPAIFVSYAHEDAGLASTLARSMQAHGARVWLDQGELLIGDSLIDRIADAIAEFDFVAALVSEASVKSNWCRKEIALAMSKDLRRGARSVTVLPLRVDDVTMPPSLADVKWEQLDPHDLDTCAARVLADATRHLRRQAQQQTPTGRTPPAPSRSGMSAAWDGDPGRELLPVSITGVDTAGIGEPRNDGTRGSGLYRVPLLLSHAPPEEWTRRFAEAWDHPPAWTSMHRPGIARVHGDRIILDGTTIEELEQYHLKTLKLVVRQLNAEVAQLLASRHREEAAAKNLRLEHQRRVQDVASRLDFDADG